MYFPPLLAVSSGEAVSGAGAGLSVLAGRSTPSFYASGSSCMGVSPAPTQDSQAPGFLETGIQPLLRHLLPALPLGEGPQPGQAPAQPPRCGVSGLHLDLLGSVEVQTGCDRAVGNVSCLLRSFCGPSPVSLVTLWGHLLFLSPLAFLYPSGWAW